MKLANWIFALFLGIGLLFTIAFFIPEVPSSHGQPHPEIQEMSIGGDGQRSVNILWLGTALGILELMLFASLLCLALHLDAKQRVWMAAGAGLMILCFLAMVFSYRSVLVAGNPANPPIFLGLPRPTAFMIYGLGLAPLVFILFYVVQFDSCVLKPERYEKFQQVLADQQRQQSIEENR